MSIYEYNEYKGPETIDMEYKLFTLHPKGTDVDPNDEHLAEKLLTTAKWQFNQPVINNIDYYIENYLPKYAAAFLNQESDPEKGEMYFGMTDDGFVQGICCIHELVEHFVRPSIYRFLCQGDLNPAFW